MNLATVSNALKVNAKEHSPVILSAMAAIGTLSTAYLTGSASFAAAKLIEEHERVYLASDDPKERLIVRIRVVWKLYIPAAISATTTIACIVGANRIEAKKTIAAQTAFAISQRAFSDYRDKVIEEYGERKDQVIRDKIAEDRVKETAPSKDVILAGTGSVLCCEMYTGRYFQSDMETLRRAQNDLNARLLGHDYATLDDFYYMIGLPRTTTSGQLGWKSTRLMELRFSTVLTEDGRPCLAFDYNYTETL